MDKTRSRWSRGSSFFLTKKGLLTTGLFLTPVLIIVFWIGVFPSIRALRDSFFYDAHGVRLFTGLENFEMILSDGGFVLSLNLSILFSFATTTLSILGAFLTACTMAFSERLSRWIYLALLIPWSVPPFILVPIWRAILHGPAGISLLSQWTGLTLNLMTQPLAAFLVSGLIVVWLSLPLTTFVFLGSIQKNPKNLLESFRMDGASRWIIARHLFWPSIQPSITIMIILNFIRFFKEFTVIYLLTAGGPPLVSGITQRNIVGATSTLEIFVYEQFQNRENYGLASAYSFMMALVVLGFLFLWLSVKSDRVKKAGPVMVLFLHLVFQGPFWLVRFLAYLLASIGWFLEQRRNRSQESKTEESKAFSLRWFVQHGMGFAVALDFLLMSFSLTQAGWLRGLYAPSIFALFVWFLLPIRRRKSRKDASIFRFRAFSVVMGAGMCLILLLSFLSLFVLIRMAFSPMSTTVFLSEGPPLGWTVRPFVDAWEKERIFQHLVNSLRLSLPVMLITPVLCFPAAYALKTMRKVVSNSLLSVFTVIGFFGGMHTLIPLFVMFRGLTAIHSYLPLVLIYVSSSIPFSLFSMNAFFHRFPKSLEDLARMEGATGLRFFWRILFPLSIPTLVPSAMVAFLSAWNGFLAPLIFIPNDTDFPMSIKISSLVGSIASGSPRWNLFAAISLINTILVVSLFLFFKKPMKHAALSDYSEE